MNHSSETNKLIHASLWTAINSYFFFAINFLGQIVLAKLLLPEDYGVYAFSFALVEACAMLLGFCNTTGFINSNGTKEDFGACIKLNIIAGAILFLFGVLGFFIIIDIEHSISLGFIFFILCVSQIFLLGASVFSAPLQKQLNFKRVSFYQGFCSSLSLGIAIFFAFLHFSYWSLVLRDFLSYFSFFIITFYFCPIRIPRYFMRANIKEQFQFGLNTTISRALELLYYRFPDIFIKLTLGKFVLGNFYQARSVTNYPIRLMQPLTQQVLFSFFTNIKHDIDFMCNRLNWINYIIVRASLPFVFFVMLFGKQLFVFVYGKQWGLAGTYFEYFSFFVPIASLFGAAMSTCFSLKKQRITSSAYLISALSFISSIAFFAKEISPPLIFSASLAIGYCYVLFSFEKLGLKLAIMNTFLLPILILVLSLCVCFFVSKPLSIISFLILFLFLMMIESKKIKTIWKKLVEYRKNSSDRL